MSSQEVYETIERDLIPRLVIAQRDQEAQDFPAVAFLPPSEQEIAALVQVVVTQDLPAAMLHIEAMTARGVSPEMMLLNAIAPAAKLLGNHWDTDLHTFTEVTTGLGMLQRLVQAIGATYAPSTGHRGLCVLTAAPGEQHTLGLFLLGEFLQRARWGVDLVPGLNQTELVALVAETKVELVAVTVSNPKLLAPMSRLITALRRNSMAPNLHVVVGGSIDLTSFARDENVLVMCAPHEAVQWLEDHAVSSLPRPRRIS